MSTFVDQMLLKFLDNSKVTELLTNLQPKTLFNHTYEVQNIVLPDPQEITLERIDRREFQMPAFETIRTSGMEERIVPTPERVKVDRAQPRYGRLAWVDVFLEVLLSTKVHDKGAPIEKITTQNLIEKLGGVDSIAELRTKLEALYLQIIVDAFFKEFRITTVEEFKRRGNLFLEFIYKTPPPYDPDDPKNVRKFPINVCVQLQPELKIAESLQAAKLCRSILENEKNFAETFEGGEIKKPYVFVVIFPNDAVVDDAIPGFTADQIKESIKNLFEAESMLAHFYEEPEP